MQRYNPTIKKTIIVGVTPFSLLQQSGTPTISFLPWEVTCTRYNHQFPRKRTKKKNQPEKKGAKKEQKAPLSSPLSACIPATAGADLRG